MPGVTLSVNTTRTLNGIAYAQGPLQLTSDFQDGGSPVAGITAAKPGSLTTRTNATQGTITLDGGHGLSTGTFDLFWNPSPGTISSAGSRTGVSCTITVNACVITGGTGDDLPTNNTPMTIKAKESFSLSVAGDDAVWALVWAVFLPTAGYGYIELTEADDTVLATYRVSGANPSTGWDGADVSTNPFAGVTVGKMKFSHGEESTQYMGAVIGYDA